MITGTNLVKDIKKTISDALIPLYGDREANSIGELLLEERFGIKNLDLAIKPDIRLTESEIVQLHKDIIKLTAGNPVQYVLGYSTFLGLRLKVNPSVLIPRPETEEMALIAINILKNLQNPRVLDIGTGSGALAIAIKSAIPSAKVMALDNSIDALKVASENALGNNTNVHFFLHDILKDNLKLNEKPNCVISNPPYIPVSEIIHIPVNVKYYEPANALFVQDDDPVLFYKKIGEESYCLLDEGGWLIVETHPTFTAKVVDLFDYLGFTSVKKHFDINGKTRFVTAKKIKKKKKLHVFF